MRFMHYIKIINHESMRRLPKIMWNKNLINVAINL